MRSLYRMEGDKAEAFVEQNDIDIPPWGTPVHVSVFKRSINGDYAYKIDAAEGYTGGDIGSCEPEPSTRYDTIHGILDDINQELLKEYDETQNASEKDGYEGGRIVG